MTRAPPHHTTTPHPLAHTHAHTRAQLYDYSGRAGNTSLAFTVEHRAAYALAFTAAVACELLDLTTLAPPPPAAPPPPPRPDGQLVFEDELVLPPPARTTPLVTLGARTLAAHFLPQLGVGADAARRVVLLAPPTVYRANATEGGLACAMDVQLGVEVGGGAVGWEAPAGAWPSAPRT
jgi:hypothetical protein